MNVSRINIDWTQNVTLHHIWMIKPEKDLQKDYKQLRTVKNVIKNKMFPVYIFQAR